MSQEKGEEGQPGREEERRQSRCSMKGGGLFERGCGWIKAGGGGR